MKQFQKARSTPRAALCALLFFLLSAQHSVFAWNAIYPHDITSPQHGLAKTGDGTHQWIVSQAITYLKMMGRIDPDSWFASDEFTELVQWGVGYADNTGKRVSVECFGVERSWDFDGNHHFYHPAKIAITIHRNNPLEVLAGELGNAICEPFAHAGQLTAPIYSQQLYDRAVEFWPYGEQPIELSSLQAPLYLGFVASAGDYIHFAGWGNGADPRNVWAIPGPNMSFNTVNGETCSDIYGCFPALTEDPFDEECFYVRKCVPVLPAKWPPWVQSTKSNPHHSAAIYLGWSIHLLQDLAVIHHVRNLHGSHHQLFERTTHDILESTRLSPNTGSIFSPDVEEGDELCTYRNVCSEWGVPKGRTNADIAASYGITVCTKFEPERVCNPALPIAPNFIYADPTTYDANSLGLAVASIVDKQFKALPNNAAPDSWADLSQANHFHYYYKYALDTAIKASAALILKFISEVSTVEYPQDQFEPNNLSTSKKLLKNGVYKQLSLHSQSDIDYYLIELQYQADLNIEIKYDRQFVNLASELHRPLGMAWGMPDADADIYDLKYQKPGSYVLIIQPITTGQYELKVAVSGKKLKPDSYEPNDSFGAATGFKSGCDFTSNLNIEQTGAEDYYYIDTPNGWRIDSTLEFNPEEGLLSLSLLDKPSLSIVSGSQGIVPGGRIVSLSACGTHPRTHFAVKGQANQYKLCLITRPDVKCGFEPESELNQLEFNISSSVPLDNVHVIGFLNDASKSKIIRGNTYTPPDSDQDLGGNVESGLSSVSMSPTYHMALPEKYLLIATSADESALVISSSQQDLIGKDFDKLFPEFNGVGGLIGLRIDISEGRISDAMLNPCKPYWEMLHLIDMNCVSVIENSGSPKGVLLTPLVDQANLFLFPGGKPIGKIIQQ